MNNPSALCGFYLDITEDDNHYYIAIDREERERAKSVVGRVWNPEIKKWVYPKTSLVYQAICEQFGGFPGKTSRITPPANGMADRMEDFQVSRSLVPSLKSTPPVSTQTNSPKANTTTPTPSTSIEEVIALLQTQTRATQRIQERLTYIEDCITKLPNNPALSVADVTESLRPLLVSLEEKILGDTAIIQNNNNTAQHTAAWLSHEIVEGTEKTPDIVDICATWDVIKDARSVIDDFEERLKNRLREILDLPHGSKKSLNDLCNEAFETNAIDKKQRALLTAFRIHRNKIAHEPRENKSCKMLRYLHALTAIALVWPNLGKSPPPESDIEDENENSA